MSRFEDMASRKLEEVAKRKAEAEAKRAAEKREIEEQNERDMEILRELVSPILKDAHDAFNSRGIKATLGPAAISGSGVAHDASSARLGQSGSGGVQDLILGDVDKSGNRLTTGAFGSQVTVTVRNGKINIMVQGNRGMMASRSAERDTVSDALEEAIEDALTRYLAR